MGITHSFSILLNRCKLPIEFADNATYNKLPDGIFPNMTFPPPDSSKSYSKAPWDSCLRLDVNFSDPTYFEQGVPANKSVGCNGQYVFDYSKYESSASIDVSL